MPPIIVACRNMWVKHSFACHLIPTYQIEQDVLVKAVVVLCCCNVFIYAIKVFGGLFAEDTLERFGATLTHFVACLY